MSAEVATQSAAVPAAPAVATTDEKQEPSTAATANGDLPKSSEKPTDADLEAALKVEVQDKDGKKVSLASLVQGDAETPRVVVVFIRHFFCGFCQEYIRHLNRELPPSKLAGLTPASKLIVIGHGDHSLIAKYVKETGCPYELYADASRQSYDRLGFVSNLQRSAATPNYFKRGMVHSLLSSVRQNLQVGSKVFSGGRISQNGGELVFDQGRLGFFSRMRNTTDHVEVEDLEKVLMA